MALKLVYFTLVVLACVLSQVSADHCTSSSDCPAQECCVQGACTAMTCTCTCPAAVNQCTQDSDCSAQNCCVQGTCKPMSGTSCSQVTPPPGQCTKGSDCASLECCVSGTCKPMGGTSAYCYTRQGYAWTRPEQMITDFDRCPCRTGWFCARINRVHPQYGQMGMCAWG